MIWALLFALLLGGSESAFLNPKVKNHIKKHVESPERKDEILTILKNYEGEIKSYNKAKKKMTKELELLNGDRDASDAAFKDLFRRFMNHQKRIDEIGLQGRLKIQALITDAEWEKLMSDAVVIHEQDKKNREKTISKLRISMSKAEQKGKNVIKEDSRKLHIQKIISDFNSTVIEIMKENKSFNHVENSVLASRTSNAAQLNQVTEEVNRLKWQFFDAYLITHMQLAEFTTEKEWSAVIKAMNKIF